uniref:Uncharacterized protein n=1 Tax=Magallana gigas TaxID=29159 RepID=K1QDX6_MAGGI
MKACGRFSLERQYTSDDVATNMEESRGSALENCWEWCYTRCFGYGQHDFQTDSSRSERLASGYKEDLPDCDTTPGMVRQSSVKSLDKYVSPCVASNFNILEQPAANTSREPNNTPEVNNPTNGKTNVKVHTHQPPRLSLLIAKKNQYQQMQDLPADIQEEDDGEASGSGARTPKRVTISDEVVVHETAGDTGEEEINTAKHTLSYVADVCSYQESRSQMECM